jgi:hypothetical protein
VPVEGYLDLSVIAPRIQGPRGADRGFIAGRSGAGKSYLGERLLNVYGIGDHWPKEFRGNKFIIDPNDTVKYPAEVEYETVEEVRLNAKVKTIRYVPKPSEYTGVKWNELWRKLFYYKEPLLVYVDETRAMEPVFRSNARFEDGNFLLTYLTRGRAKNKAAILGAQRPVLIPRDIIGQAEWFYVFDLPLEDDRATMAGSIGELGLVGDNQYLRVRDRNSLDRFEFWFRGPDLTEPVRAQIVK